MQISLNNESLQLGM